MPFLSQHNRIPTFQRKEQIPLEIEGARAWNWSNRRPGQPPRTITSIESVKLIHLKIN